MTAIRKEIHDEIDLMSEKELVGLKKFLRTYPDVFAAVYRRAPIDDEPVTEAERLAMEEAEEEMARDPGGWIPHEEIMRRYGDG